MKLRNDKEINALFASAHPGGAAVPAAPTEQNSPGSVSCPQFMVSRSRTVMAARFSLTVAGSLSGKKEMTLSVSFSLPSEAASPTAVAVNVLLTEFRM